MDINYLKGHRYFEKKPIFINEDISVIPLMFLYPSTKSDIIITKKSGLPSTSRKSVPQKERDIIGMETNCEDDTTSYGADTNKDIADYFLDFVTQRLFDKHTHSLEMVRERSRFSVPFGTAIFAHIGYADIECLPTLTVQDFNRYSRMDTTDLSVATDIMKDLVLLINSSVPKSRQSAYRGALKDLGGKPRKNSFVLDIDSLINISSLVREGKLLEASRQEYRENLIKEYCEDIEKESLKSNTASEELSEEEEGEEAADEDLMRESREIQEMIERGEITSVLTDTENVSEESGERASDSVQFTVENILGENIHGIHRSVAEVWRNWD